MPSPSPEELEKQLVLEFFGSRTEGFFIEVGANDPQWISQTWELERRGWRGLLIEPQSCFFDKLVAARPHSRVVQAACTSADKRGTGQLHLSPSKAFATLEKFVDDQGIEFNGVETVRLLTLDEILEQDPPKKVDFISIDVEGTELDVLRGFNMKRWQPELLLVEDKLNHLQKHRYMLGQGYRLLRRIGVNSWYVPASHPAKLPFMDRVRLFRKYYLGTPLRRYKRDRAARRRQASAGK